MENDLHLLARYHRQGDASAFQALVQAHAGMVHATAHRVTQDAALAQDVAQEAFLALARSSGTAIRCVGAWLHRVTCQKARNAARGAARRHRNEAAAAPYLHEPPAEATWAHLEPLLDEALEKLPEPSRELIVQHFLQGLSQLEMARRLGVSQTTVSRRVSQAVDELRTHLYGRGAVSAAALSALLVANGSQAAPAALTASLGKLALAGTGTAIASSLSFTSPAVLLMKFCTSKLALATATVAGLFFAAAGYHLASPGTKMTQQQDSTPVGAAATAKSKQTTPPSSREAAAASESRAADNANLSSQVTGPDSSQTRITKLAALTKQKDFKALVFKLFSSRNPHHVAQELQRLMGLTLSEQEITRSMNSVTSLELAVLLNLAGRHPHEALAWMAMLDDHDFLINDVLLSQVLQRHPEITAQSVSNSLPAGPNREAVLGYLRAQADPVAEAERIIATAESPFARSDRLWELANVWPKNRLQEAVDWALENLEGKDLQAFLPRAVHHLSGTSPDRVVDLMRQIEDPDLLKQVLTESMHGLIHQNDRIPEVAALIGTLNGDARAKAISELTRRWVRVDQDGLMQWINNLESPADFEAALPLTLAQLSPENYAAAMDTLMPQLDGSLDAAVIRAAGPDFSGAIRTSVDIVQRLTQLPQYSSIGSGQSGNQDLLWQTVNGIAAGWIIRQGAAPADGARWIDSLPFRTDGDKATVAQRLYSQWKVSDPAAASLWAAGAGVQLP